MLGRLWVPHEEWRRAWRLGSACLSPDSPQSQFRYAGGNSLSCWWVQLGPQLFIHWRGGSWRSGFSDNIQDAP